MNASNAAEVVQAFEREVETEPAARQARDAVDTAEQTVTEGATFLARLGERGARWFTRTRLPVVAKKRDQAEQAIRNMPKRLQRLTNQTSLVIELVDDFRAKRYRDISWPSIAVATGAIIYVISPADAIPDFIPVAGLIDEAVVLALATRLIRKDLVQYAEYKGYDPSEYFEKY